MPAIISNSLVPKRQSKTIHRADFSPLQTRYNFYPIHENVVYDATSTNTLDSKTTVWGSASSRKSYTCLVSLAPPEEISIANMRRVSTSSTCDSMENSWGYFVDTMAA